MLIANLFAEPCPDCGSDLQHFEVDQPALFALDGQGVAERTVIVSCPTCPYRVHRDAVEAL